MTIPLGIVVFVLFAVGMVIYGYKSGEPLLRDLAGVTLALMTVCAILWSIVWLCQFNITIGGA